MSKLIIVTGGTKGIGRSVIEKFASHGFDIATCARNAAELATFKMTVEQNFPAIKVFTMAADLSDKHQVDSFCDFIKSLARPIDILVNNAGFFISGDIATEPDGTLEAMINANLYSAYHTTRGLISLMKEKRVSLEFLVHALQL